MKNTFSLKYDFLNQNKGIQACIAGIVFCLFIIAPKHDTPTTIFFLLLYIALLFGSFYFFNNFLSKKNFDDKKLMTLNKLGWFIYSICLAFVAYWIWTGEF